MVNDSEKKLEKQLIRFLVADPSHATAQNRKARIKEKQLQANPRFKTLTTDFHQHLSTAAKGQWVKAAKQDTSKTLSRLNQLT